MNEKFLMTTIIITETRNESGSPLLNVAQGDRCADHLNFDEMLGQVVSLAHPRLRLPHYHARHVPREERAKFGMASLPMEDRDFAEVGGEAIVSPAERDMTPSEVRYRIMTAIYIELGKMDAKGNERIAHAYLSRMAEIISSLDLPKVKL